MHVQNMIPPPLVDWAVWSNLNRYRDVELILLKGHMLLEVMLVDRLRACPSMTEAQIKKLPFSAKVRVLALSFDQLSETIELANQLNSLRNRLAHEPFPNELRLELFRWSEKVLPFCALYKHQRYTPRTKISQAISALARSIAELSIHETCTERSAPHDNDALF